MLRTHSNDASYISQPKIVIGTVTFLLDFTAEA